MTLIKNNSIEFKLRELILSRYKSINEFAKTTNMPYSTIDSIFKRGIENASVSNLSKICKTLDISLDMLTEGYIVTEFSQKEVETKKETAIDIFKVNDTEKTLIINFRRLNSEMQVLMFKQIAMMAAV